MATETISVLYNKICGIIEAARAGTSRSVNAAQAVSNWLIGREIVEIEQGGAHRAAYGAKLLPALAARLKTTYGPGYGEINLKLFRKFYFVYPGFIGLQKGYTLRNQSTGLGSEAGVSALKGLSAEISRGPTGADWRPGLRHCNMSWSHYRALIKIQAVEQRSFYEIESIRGNWCARELERQINTQLYERLALSRDKKGVLDLAKRGQIVQRPIDILKDPVVLEFADLPESERLNETDLERALIGKLQAFLLELGEGFAFVGRQKRLTLDGDHFYPDLVFYHIKLKCYVIIELKTGKLTHGDLGQILMYVNYYDREVAGAADNPTIGLMLCTEKNDAVVKYVLDEKKKRIFASRYRTCLPSEEELRAELRRELGTLPPKGR